jgi:hypothetical protein
MSHDDSPEAAVREYLAGAGRALERGDATSASVETICALAICLSIVRECIDSDPLRYRAAWERVATELAKLQPSLLRHAVRIIDARGRGPTPQ